MNAKNISKVIAGVGASLITGALVMNLDTSLADNQKAEVKKVAKTLSGTLVKKQNSNSGALNPAIQKKITLANMKLKQKLLNNSGALAGSRKLKEIPKFGSGMLNGTGMLNREKFEKREKFGSGKLDKPKFGSGELFGTGRFEKREKFGSGNMDNMPNMENSGREIQKYDTKTSAS